ncbi:MAG TPA: DUF167 domain-containing protein [Candidatus Acidoferrales bacterium]|nr:DUF167 domain-containing protein [Candidatus Acidoferrales bacterium]
MIRVATRDGAVIFQVRVQPRSSRNAMAGEFQGALKIRLTAPPVDDRANEALCRFLAECLNVSPSAVKILSGQKSRTKRVEVQGIAASQISALT